MRALCLLLLTAVFVLLSPLGMLVAAVGIVSAVLVRRQPAL